MSSSDDVGPRALARGERANSAARRVGQPRRRCCRSPAGLDVGQQARPTVASCALTTAVQRPRGDTRSVTISWVSQRRSAALTVPEPASSRQRAATKPRIARVDSSTAHRDTADRRDRPVIAPSLHRRRVHRRPAQRPGQRPPRRPAPPRTAGQSKPSSSGRGPATSRTTSPGRDPLQVPHGVIRCASRSGRPRVSGWRCRRDGQPRESTAAKSTRPGTSAGDPARHIGPI